jgi:hypothetical protein
MQDKEPEGIIIMNKSPLTIVTLLAALATSTAALAASELRVNGRANVDGDFTLESNKLDVETGDPLARTAISVDDADPGVFEYLAAADITTPKLQIFGSLNNSGGAIVGSELSLLSVNSSLRDTITLTSASLDSYTVTAALIVDGTLDVDGSDGRVTAQIKVDPTTPDRLSKTETRVYNTNGTIVGDVLPISYDFVGDAVFDITSSLFFFVNSINAATSVTADFSNTAIITLTITGPGAPGVSMTSASGAFGTNPVPLPAGLPLLLSALGGFGFWGRSRRAH